MDSIYGYYRVSVLTDIITVPSNFVQFVVACPSDLTIEQFEQEIHLNWQDNSTTETGFEISLRISGSNEEWQIIGDIVSNSTDFIDNIVACETTYEHKVRAYRSTDNTTTDSNVKSVFTHICPVMAPISFTSISRTETSINLAWQDMSDNETGFVLNQVFEDDTPNITIATLPTDATTFIHTGLECETAYSYELQAFRTISDTRHSSTVLLSYQSGQCEPKLPANFAMGALTGNSVQLTWQDISPKNTSHIIVERAEQNPNAIVGLSVEQGLAWQTKATLPSWINVFTDDDLRCGMIYWYRVQGYNERYQEYT